MSKGAAISSGMDKGRTCVEVHSGGCWQVSGQGHLGSGRDVNSLILIGQSFIVLIEIWQLVILSRRRRGRRRKEKGRGNLESTQDGSHSHFSKIISALTSFHFCPILMRSEWIGPVHFKLQVINKKVKPGGGGHWGHLRGCLL